MSIRAVLGATVCTSLFIAWAVTVALRPAIGIGIALVSTGVVVLGVMWGVFYEAFKEAEKS